MNKTFDMLLSTVYPSRCKLCGSVIEFDKTLCKECENAKQIEGKICNKCGRNTENCICKKQRFSPDYVSFCAPYYFELSMAEGVYRFKNGYKQLASGMAQEICIAVNKRFVGINFDYICSVPLSKRRLRKRGYNQSEILAKKVSEILGVPYRDMIIKTRNTSSQRLSSGKKRRENLFGAFDVKKGVDLKDKTVLIVDDVKTTGSTLSECSAMLKIEGAKVYAAAFTVTNTKAKGKSDAAKTA